MNGGSVVATGFARRAVLSHAEEIVNAVKAGSIRHFFLIGGCDGTRPSRRYYTDFAKLTPPDTVILTLACGKFRLNDLPLGTVAGLPRILDVGQCNDAYSAIRIALGLAEAFDCSVNELPLSIILCWFEQKAVCVLMALLALASGASVSGRRCRRSSPRAWPLSYRKNMTSSPSPPGGRPCGLSGRFVSVTLTKSPRHAAERAGGLFVQSGEMRKLSALGRWLFSGAARCVQNRPPSALRSHRSG